MKKYLVVYYSKSGNNKFLAEKVSNELNCDSEELIPRMNVLLFLMLSLLTKISIGNRHLKISPEEYDHIILCGPLWVGTISAPLWDFLRKYKKNIKQISFITCCGSSDKVKGDKFGYDTIFPKVREYMGGMSISCKAFPINLVVAQDKKEDSEAAMATRLNDNNFKGEIQERFNLFIQELRSNP